MSPRKPKYSELTAQVAALKAEIENLRRAHGRLQKAFTLLQLQHLQPPTILG